MVRQVIVACGISGNLAGESGCPFAKKLVKIWLTRLLDLGKSIQDLLLAPLLWV